MNSAENPAARESVLKALVGFLFILLLSANAVSQGRMPKWSKDGNAYYMLENNEVIKYSLPDNIPEKIISSKKLIPLGKSVPLEISFFAFSEDQQQVLLFTNTQKVWRLNTRGDYWVMDMKSGSLRQLGKTLPASSLMFAKFSPDGGSVAYVSGNNLYVEALNTSQIKPLTVDGTRTMINGTFDWVYEEEFTCRDGFRWSHDSKSIAYWQVDAGKVNRFNMINNTDSVYSRIVPVEYPKVGEKPSPCKVGVVNVSDATTTWIKIPGEPDQHYIIRMEFIPFSNDLLIQQLNRKQNCSRLFVSEITSGNSKLIHEETDETWIDFNFLDYVTGNPYTIDFTNSFTWLSESRSILWLSEKDGWKHLYQVSLESKPEKLLTKGNYDVTEIKYADPRANEVYFIASPDNATQRYLYRAGMDGEGKPELVSPSSLKGIHDYSVSPGGKYAFHSFTNHFTRPSGELISLPRHKALNEQESIMARLKSFEEDPVTEFFKITTADNVEMDGWMVKPRNFDPTKKYPVVFYVYTEAWESTVTDRYGVSMNPLYRGDMAEDGYIYMSLDNRGTSVPKGSTWRKSVYRKIGQLNIRDQAMAAREILKWDFVDPNRIAVWGWSGGGSATLNLLFQYPEIYKTGIAIAAVSNLLTYDNIYMERYMGLPQENREDYLKGSPLTYAKNLKGNLLYIHGTGDDNVHYQNAEMLVNELIKYNRQFQFMPYPNRTHSISEGEGTAEHLMTLYTNYLRMYCPPGAK